MNLVYQLFFHTKLHIFIVLIRLKEYVITEKKYIEDYTKKFVFPALLPFKDFKSSVKFEY